MALNKSTLLIRDYENIRSILRDVYIYGCFSKDDYVEKQGISGRKYDKEQQRISAYLPKKYRTKYTSIYNPVTMITSGWETVRNFKKVRKFLMVGFLFAAMFTLLAVSNTLGILDVQPEDFRTTNGQYITVSNPDKNDKLMSVIEGLGSVSYVMPGDSKISVTLPMDDYLQTGYFTGNLNVSLTLTSVLAEEDIVYGKMPEGDHEVILDKMVIDEFFRYDTGKPIGLDTYEEFLGRRITITNLDDYIITGISGTSSPSLFVDESQMMYILTNAAEQTDEYSFDYYTDEDGEGDAVRSGRVKDYALAGKGVVLKKGKAPKDLYEVLINIDHEDEESYAIGKTVNTKMAGHKLKITGYYSSDSAMDEDVYYVAADTIKKDYISKQKSFTVYAPNTNQVKALLDTQSVSFKVNDARDRQAYIHERKDQLTSSVMVAGIIFLISLIEMFLMLRSSFLSRIREVGTLRAIGLKKKDIYRMFTGEILAITAIASGPGWLLMNYIIYKMQNISYLSDMFVCTPQTVIASLALILGFNLVFGLLPVFHTLIKRPAAILARTDVN